MTWEAVQIAIVLTLVAAVFVGFVRERLPPDVVAMIAVGVLLISGVLGVPADRLALAYPDRRGSDPERFIRESRQRLG